MQFLEEKGWEKFLDQLQWPHNYGWRGALSSPSLVTKKVQKLCCIFGLAFYVEDHLLVARTREGSGGGVGDGMSAAHLTARRREFEGVARGLFHGWHLEEFYRIQKWISGWVEDGTSAETLGAMGGVERGPGGHGGPAVDTACNDNGGCL